MRLELVQKHLQRYSEDGNGCWNWTGPLRNGYGHMRTGAATVGAHRFFFEQHVRPLNAGEWVLHKCDNKVCVNPDHLYAGTHRDNVRDAVERGLFTGNRKAGKLTDDQVAEIRRSDQSSVSLSRKYGVGKSAIRDVRRGETYRRVPLDERPYIGRAWAVGANHHSAKLTAAEAAEIKAALRASVAPRALAERYGVSYDSIRNIKRGRTWASIDA